LPRELAALDVRAKRTGALCSRRRATELEEILARTLPDGHRRLHQGGPGPGIARCAAGFALDGADGQRIVRALTVAVRIR
jgi:hypothetical protein